MFSSSQFRIGLERVWRVQSNRKNMYFGAGHEIPSLQQLSQINIGKYLHKSREIVTYITKCDIRDPFFANHVNWTRMEAKVAFNVDRLPLPKFLKGDVKDIALHIGREILEWLRSSRVYKTLYSNIHLMYLEYYLCNIEWTPHGTVNHVKMARMMVKDGRLHVGKRLKLAVHYCLGDEVGNLSRYIHPTSTSHAFLDFEDNLSLTTQGLTFYWSKIMNNEEYASSQHWNGHFYEPLSSVLVRFFQSAVETGKYSAIEYFWDKLPAELRGEQMNMLTRGSFILEDTNPKVLFPFLNTKLTDEERVRYFEANIYHVLRGLMDWPHCYYLMEAASNIWEHMGKKHFYSLLLEALSYARKYPKNKTYVEFLKHCWTTAPVEYRLEHMLRKHFVSLLIGAQNIPDVSLTMVLLNDFHAQREEIGVRLSNSKYDELICGFVHKMILNQKWDLLDMFCNTCVTNAKMLDMITSSALSQHNKSILIVKSFDTIIHF